MEEERGLCVVNEGKGKKKPILWGDWSRTAVFACARIVQNLR